MARLSTLMKLKNAQKQVRELTRANEVLNNLLSDADERAKAADLEAARASKDKDLHDSHLETANRRVRLLELELATLRGYAQRIIQTDNAHHAPNTFQREGKRTEVHLKFGLPDVEQPVRLDVAPKFADSFYRNR